MSSGSYLERFSVNFAESNLKLGLNDSSGHVSLFGSNQHGPQPEEEGGNYPLPLFEIDAIEGLIGRTLTSAGIQNRLRLNPRSGQFRLGGGGNSGGIHLYDSRQSNDTKVSQAQISLDAMLKEFKFYDLNEDGNIVRKFDLDFRGSNLRMGGGGSDGDIVLFDSEGNNSDNPRQASVHIDSDERKITCRDRDEDGNIVKTINLDFSTSAEIRLGDLGDHTEIRRGKIRMWGIEPSSSGIYSITMENGNMRLMSPANIGSIELENGNISLTGEIDFLNGDLAEEFSVSPTVSAEPGDVLVLGDKSDDLELCSKSYDKKVVGIYSGAGAYKPAMVLNKRKGQDHKAVPISLSGRALCKVDATYGSVERGDLLTTSDTVGHAMKAIDPKKIMGTIIGKALKPLEAGKGLIPVLVNIQ